MIESTILIRSARIYLWVTIIGSSLVMGLSLGLSFFWSISVGMALCAVASAGFLLNDAVDWQIDRENGLQRLSGAPASLRTNACVLAAILALVSLLISLLLLDTATSGCIAALIIAASLYSYPLRRVPVLATLISTGLCTSPLWLPFWGSTDITADHWHILVAACLTVFAREIILDVRDVKGDQQYGRCTIPVAIGAEPALSVAVWLLYAAAGVVALMAIRHPVQGISFWLIVLSFAGVVLLHCRPASAIVARSDAGAIETYVHLSRAGLGVITVGLASAIMAGG